MLWIMSSGTRSSSKSRNRRRSRRSSNVWAVAGLFLAVVLGIGAVIALIGISSARNAALQEELEGYVPYSSSTNAASEALPVAVFIGDSYSHGTGASVPENRWTTLVSESKGWDEENLSLGGTGYLKTAGINGCGREICDNYDTVVLSNQASNADTYVVAGGQNDFALWRTDSAAVSAAIDKTYDDLRAQYPDATIIAVGPSTVGEVGTTVTGFDSAVQNAAARIGATYVSLIAPNIVTPDMVTVDGGHVQDAGHRAIADRVLAAIG